MLCVGAVHRAEIVLRSMADKCGFKDIPGVFGPIEDPYQRERKRLYADPMIDIPVFEFKSNWNPIPLFQKIIYYTFEWPIDKAYDFIRSITVTKPLRYYHHKFRRVPPIWECSTDDPVCLYEAESQFRRDMKIDQEILDMIQMRYDVCICTHPENEYTKCKEVEELLERVRHAWHVKYGELGIYCNARNVLNKQKNRFIEERYLARIGKSDTPYLD